MQKLQIENYNKVKCVELVMLNSTCIYQHIFIFLIEKINTIANLFGHQNVTFTQCVVDEGVVIEYSPLSSLRCAVIVVACSLVMSL